MRVLPDRCYGCDCSVSQHPEVYAATALTGINDQAASAQGDTAECPGHDPSLTPVQHKWTQVYVAWLKPVVDKVFPLAEVRAAYEHLASGEHVGKVCIEM